MAAFAIFVSYNMFGRNYGAAVMAAGNCGWGCGSGPNAVANEKAVMDEYGWHNVAWVLYPSFAVIIDDIYNLSSFPYSSPEALSNKVHVHLLIINSLKRPAPQSAGRFSYQSRFCFPAQAQLSNAAVHPAPKQHPSLRKTICLGRIFTPVL